MVIIIPGECVPKARPRVKKIGYAYTEPKTLRYENYVRKIFKQHCDQPTDKPVRMTIHVVRDIPKSWSKKKYYDAIEGKIKATTRPDVDNYIKGLLDAANGILFNDDNQVIDLRVTKCYGPDAMVKILLEEIND